MTVLASGILLYRPATVADEPHLLLLRNRDNGQWGFPKGRRESEDAHEVATAMREVLEETGYQGLVLHPTFRCCLKYQTNGGATQDGWKRSVYFLARAPATDPVLSVEHSEFEWANRRLLSERLAHGQLCDMALRAMRTIEQDDVQPETQPEL
jgi:8-oxo-dGTP pyrophosphatase MutT (NUDIX family)